MSLDLFADIEQVTDTETGEVTQQEAPPAPPPAPIADKPALTPEERQAIARRLGIGRIVVEDKNDADRILQKRAAIISELTLVSVQTHKMLAELESELKALDTCFAGELEHWTKANVPEGKKTIKLPHGDLKLRDQGESISMDTERDPGGKLYAEWASKQKEDFRATFGIHPETRWTIRDHDGIKKWYMAAIHRAQSEKKPIPVIPGLCHKPAQLNKFSIAPSLDTIHKNIKEELERSDEQ